MEKITKVKDINITKLNNAEYRTFMARYGNLLAGGGGDSNLPTKSASTRTTRWASPKNFVRPSPPISPY